MSIRQKSYCRNSVNIILEKKNVYKSTSYFIGGMKVGGELVIFEELPELADETEESKRLT